ncbi:winged helix-turn-helix domain-containing protein [Bradyrhizobium sp. TZ2]
MATSAEQLVGSLADRISAKISAGEYPPGSRLRQEALAEEFSVSRTPIREALRQLEVKGVIQHRPNQGRNRARAECAGHPRCLSGSGRTRRARHIVGGRMDYGRTD